MSPSRSVRLGFFVFVFLFASAAQAAGGASQSFDAKQKVLKKISFVKNSDLQFPEIVQGDGDTVLAPANGAQGTVSGQPNKSFTISFGASTITMNKVGVNNPNANQKITVKDFKTDQTNNVGTLDGNGNKAIKLGATSSPPATVEDGDYLGTFTVTVAY